MKISTLLRTFLSVRDYGYIALLTVFAGALSILETLCLSAVMPFLLFALHRNGSWTESVLQYLPVRTDQLVFIVGLCLFAAFIIRAVATAIFTRWLYQFAQQKFQTIAGSVFSHYMVSSFQDYLKWNSAAVLKMVTNDPFHVGVVVSSLLLACAELCVVGAMYGMLLWVNWKVTLGITLLLALVAALFLNSFLSKIKAYGEQNGIFLRQLTQVFNEGFGNFKMIRLTHVEKLFTDRFDVASQSFSQAHAHYSILQAMPRLVLETVMMSSLVGGTLLLVYFYQERAAQMIFSTISFYGIAFYRLVPAANRLMNYYGQISFSLNSIGTYEAQLLQIAPPRVSVHSQELTFKTNLVVHSLSFAYASGSNVLSNLSLTIERGSAIGIIGKSGAGKSTFIDILLGLHEPTGGCLVVDDVILTKEHLYSWQHKIGYIPQHIYLFEGTVADNVVFGRPYDQAWLVHCLIKAQIYDFLQTKDGIATRVGEGGGQLSGGQRQRIALARALYGNPEILILDEATSGLDKETEALVYQDLFEVAQDKTLIIVSHRTEMLVHCDQMYEIKDGVALAVMSHTENRVREKELL
jgi:ATP-binding cassette, subfamily B, bacterial PglK